MSLGDVQNFSNVGAESLEKARVVVKKDKVGKI